MTKRLKLILIIVSVMLISVLTTAIGLTAARWSTMGGESEYGPTVSTPDWNSWKKYFRNDAELTDDDYHEYNDYEVFTHEENESTIFDGLAIFGFYGTNLGDVIFPSQLGAEGNIDVSELRNTIFTDSTKKDLPVAIYIPGTIQSISANTFSNLPNLEIVVFAAGNEVDVDEYAFAFCRSLTTVIIEGGRTVNFADTTFAGCTALNSITGETLSDYQI